MQVYPPRVFVQVAAGSHVASPSAHSSISSTHRPLNGTFEFGHWVLVKDSVSITHAYGCARRTAGRRPRPAPPLRSKPWQSASQSLPPRDDLLLDNRTSSPATSLATRGRRAPRAYSSYHMPRTARCNVRDP